MIFDIRAGVTRWYLHANPGHAGHRRGNAWVPVLLLADPGAQRPDPVDHDSRHRDRIADPQHHLHRSAAGPRHDLRADADLHLDQRPPRTEVRRRIPSQRSELLPEQQPRRHVLVRQPVHFAERTNTGGASGSGLASFLLGLSNNSSLVQTSLFTFAQLYYQGYFITDTWQATNKLTVTAGLRWEIPGVYRERYNRQAIFNPTEPNPALNGITVTASPCSARSIW